MMQTNLAFLLLIIGMLSILLAVLGGGRKRESMARRIALVADSDEAKAPQGAASVFRKRLEQFAVAVRRIVSIGMGRRWAMTASGLLLLTAAASSGVAALFVIDVLTEFSEASTLIFAAAAFMIMPRLILAWQQRGAEAAFIQAFPDALDAITRMLQAGLPIASAIRSVGSEAPAPINRVFINIADQINIGVGIADALDWSSKDVGLPDFRFFTVAVGLQSSTGGNLVSMLERLSDIMRKRRAVRKKAKAVTAEIRFAAYILGALPFLTIGALLVIQPDYLNILFGDPRGRTVVWVAGALLLLAVFSMRSMMGSINKI